MKTWQSWVILFVFPISVFAADEVVLTLNAVDGKFEPAELKAPANSKIRLEVKNSGKKPIEFESHDLHKEKVIPAGGSASFSIPPKKAGRYVFFDEFNEKNARGVLVVQ